MRPGGWPAGRFVARLAWRESRAAWRPFAGFLGAVALGVGALVGVASLTAAIERTIAREARALLGGDLELRSAAPLDGPAEAALAGLQARGAAVARVRELVGTARDPARGASLLAELKAVDPPYPLYGQLHTEPAGLAARGLGEREAVVEGALLDRLGLRVGDPVALGAAGFVVAGVLTREPDRPAALVSLGPRVLLSAAGLARTGLVQHGSRVRHRALVRLPGGLEAEAVRADLLRTIPDATVRVSSYDEAQPGLRRFSGQLATYLRLAGLTGLFVGGVGVAAGVQAFVRRKLVTVAILKCLGAGSRAIVAAYVLQALVLGGLGSLGGLVLAALVTRLLAPVLASLLPFELGLGLAPGAVATGLLVGLLTTLLCALWPLLGARRVPPAILLRHPVATPGAPRPRRPWLAALVIAGGLAGLALWQAGSLRIGGIFVAAALGAVLLLAALGWGARRLARRLPRPPSVAWRYGLAALDRPGSQAVGVAVALGIGVMLLVAVALLERGLARQLDHESRREAPSFFFVDVQADQTDALARAVAAVPGAPSPALIPVVRARLAAVNGEPVTRARWAGREDAWRVTREYVLTQAAEPPRGTVIARGRWWAPGDPGGRAWISVEAEAARALGVGVGGTLTFDVQGVPIEGTVMSLRKVDWQSLSVNFFVIFSPGALDGAPLAYLATLRVPRDAERPVQERVAAALPNVTAIPVREVLDRVGELLDRMGRAVRVVALFVLGAGVTVVASALAQGRAQRLYEAVLLKTLGATRGRIGRAFAVEYGVLGLVAGLGGTALGAALAWVVLRVLLDMPWRAEPAVLAGGVALAVLVAVGVGFLGSARLLARRPLPVLRGE
jgi:putative ABC transport system permease protein